MLINKNSIISFGLITCMLMPKIDLIPVPGYYQGLRYDDFILLTGFIYILLQRKIFLHVFPGRNIYFVFYPDRIFVTGCNLRGQKFKRL